jgi:urease accessory protein
MILASIVVLGVLIALAIRPDPRIDAVVVGALALFHGHAHGAERGAAGAVPFGIGFALATAALHAAGIGLGLLIARGARHSRVTSLLGAVTALLGLGLAIG